MLLVYFPCPTPEFSLNLRMQFYLSNQFQVTHETLCIAHNNAILVKYYFNHSHGTQIIMKAVYQMRTLEMCNDYNKTPLWYTARHCSAFLTNSLLVSSASPSHVLHVSCSKATDFHVKTLHTLQLMKTRLVILMRSQLMRTVFYT
jgi:hypothetical protein